MLNRFFLLLFFIQSFAFAQDIPQKPNPPRFVNDLVGGLLSQGEIDQLEQKLKAYNDSTSTQIAIVIVNSVQPYDISEYAVKLGRKWGVGQKDKNNGIVLLWAPSDRKVFIATGYGVEGGLTDAYSKRIIEEIIKPNFKESRYYQGLDEATNRIFKYLAGEFDADPSPAASTTNTGSWEDLLLMVVFFIVVVALLLRPRSGGDDGGTSNTTYTSWGSSSGSSSSDDGDSSSSSSSDFGGGSFGGGGAGGDY